MKDIVEGLAGFVFFTVMIARNQVSRFLCGLFSVLDRGGQNVIRISLEIREILWMEFVKVSFLFHFSTFSMLVVYF